MAAPTPILSAVYRGKSDEIATLLREHMATLEEVPQAQIFASDLDGRALASARAGRYAEDVAKDITPERLARITSY